jgi:hypothetical protein
VPALTPSRWRHWPLAAVLAIAGVLLFTNLQLDYLWSDEGACRERRLAKHRERCVIVLRRRNRALPSTKRRAAARPPRRSPSFTLEERSLLVPVVSVIAAYAVVMAVAQPRDTIWGVGMRYTPAVLPFMGMIGAVLIARVRIVSIAEEEDEPAGLPKRQWIAKVVASHFIVHPRDRMLVIGTHADWPATARIGADGG